MVWENEVCHLSRCLQTGMADQGNEFEGCYEQACQQHGEAGVLEERHLWERPPSGVAEHKPLKQLGQEGYPWYQVSGEAVASPSGQRDLEAHPGLIQHQLCGWQAWAPSGKICSDQLPGPF